VRLWKALLPKWIDKSKAILNFLIAFREGAQIKSSECLNDGKQKSIERHLFKKYDNNITYVYIGKRTQEGRRAHHDIE